MTSTNTTTGVRRVRSFRSMGLTLLAAASLAACGDSLGVDGPQNVSVSFRAVEAGSMAAAPASTGPVTSAPARAIILVGTNGTLVLDEIYMIVTEIELEHEDGCDDDDGFNGQTFDDCEDFESGPHFVSLPLDGTPIVVSTTLVAAGVYDELEFEVEDLDDDDHDKGGRLNDLHSQIRATVPDWPQKASIYVTGSFQAVGKDAVAFRTFIEGEIEVELDLIPNLVIGNSGSANRDLIVDMRPDLWFRDFQGWVLDLREWDYDTTGRLLELEIEIENGFIEVEIDD